MTQYQNIKQIAEAYGHPGQWIEQDSIFQIAQDGMYHFYSRGIDGMFSLQMTGSKSLLLPPPTKGE